MQNPRPKFNQSFIISEKPDNLSEKLKTWWAPTTIVFNIFGWNFARLFLLKNVRKRVFGIFFILLRLWVINKNVNNLVSASAQKSGLFNVLQITQDLSNIKKSWTPFCKHWKVGNECQILAKVLDYVAVEAHHQSFQFSRQNI